MSLEGIGERWIVYFGNGGFFWTIESNDSHNVFFNNDYAGINCKKNQI